MPLNRVGRRQADAVAARLARLGPVRVVSSDLSRAVATAEAVAAASGVAVEVDRRLREIDVGTWQGRTTAQVAAEYPWFAEALAEGRDFRRSDTGETSLEAGRRVEAAIVELASERPGEVTVVVGHGLSLRVGAALVAGLGLQGSFALAGLRNCSVTILEHHDRWRILTYNAVEDSRPG